ncbi:hypothetical protein ABZ570_14810 [Micromonospora sp. NPDC007271]
MIFQRMPEPVRVAFDAELFIARTATDPATACRAAAHILFQQTERPGRR